VCSSDLKCHISVVVSGAVGYKKLIKVLQSTVCNLLPRESVSADVCENRIFKEVYIESKYVGRSLHYFYKIPKEDLAPERAFFRIFRYELFDFLQKPGSLISHYSCDDIISNGDCIREAIFYPRADVSIADFQRFYENFTDRICRQEITPDVFEKIKTLNDYSLQFLMSDLYAVYTKIKNDHLNGVEEELEFNDSKQFNSFGEKILKQNFILKIVTKYRPDK
jgi:hypothetical protein